MNRITGLAVTAILFYAFPVAVQATFVTGQELQAGLRDWEATTMRNPAAAFAAFGYVVGASDASDEVAWCSPPNISRGQIAKIVLKFLDANPDKLHFAGDGLVNMALKSVWPCKKNP